MAAKKTTKKGKRYSEEEKAAILKFVDDHGRGGASAAAKKYGVSPLTISTWRKSVQKPAKARKSAGGVDRDDVLRSLAAKGFKIVRMMNVLTGEMLDEKIDPKIEKLNLGFDGLKAKADDGITYVTQSSGQVLVTMTLERLLTLTGTKP